jgi:hypothetical protein
MLELRIEFDETTGQTQVHGPLENKFVCYGMLEMAKELIATFKPKEASRIVPGIAALPKLRRQ